MPFITMETRCPLSTITIETRCPLLLWRLGGRYHNGDYKLDRDNHKLIKSHDSIGSVYTDIEG